ncbi:NAD-dependent deacetylase hst3 [Rhodosporidiobolus nylandii]
MLVLPLDGADGLPDPTLEVLADLAVSLSRPSRQVVAAVGSGVSTNAGIPDFRGHAGLSVLPSIPQHGPQRTKRLFSYSSLLDPTSRSQHLQLMAGFHDRARAIRKSLVPSGTGGRSKKGSRKGKERAVDEGGTGAAPPPTAFHALLHELNRRDQLARVWSQNIDGLEGVAGLEYVDLASLSPFSGPTAATTAGDDSASDWEAGPASRRPHKRRRLAGPSAVATKEEDQREREKQNRGKVVALHGTLGEVVCSVCGHRERWKGKHSRAFREGQAVACGRCEERAVSSALDFDLSSAASPPDFLLVAGTTLRIPGFKGIVKEVSRAVRANGGTCVMVNRETVGNVKEWDGVFDYFCASVAPLLPQFHVSPPLLYTSPDSSANVIAAKATGDHFKKLATPSFLSTALSLSHSSILDLDLLTSPQQRVLGPAFLPSSRAPSPKKRFRHALRPASLPGQHAPSVSGQEGESIGLAEMLREAERECFTPTEGCPGCADGVAAEEDGQVGKRARAMERALGELSASADSPSHDKHCPLLALPCPNAYGGCPGVLLGHAALKAHKVCSDGCAFQKVACKRGLGEDGEVRCSFVRSERSAHDEVCQWHGVVN